MYVMRKHEILKHDLKSAVEHACDITINIEQACDATVNGTADVQRR